MTSAHERATMCSPAKTTLNTSSIIPDTGATGNCVKPTKKHYLIFFKGKLYKFNATNNYD